MLTFEVVQRLIAESVQVASEQGLSIAASVVDTGGHLLAFVRMDGVGYLAVEVTRRKALTAGSFRTPTHALAAIGNADPVVGGDLAKNQEICLVPGGVPIILNGACVGGLGIAGGRSAQDQAVAEAAVAVLG